MTSSEQNDGVLHSNFWPTLPLNEWQDTLTTLQMWTQIVGKIRLVQSPLINHWWQVTMYVTARGLTTSAIPYGQRTFEIDFDFIVHQLVVRTSDGAIRSISSALAISSRLLPGTYGDAAFSRR